MRSGRIITLPTSQDSPAHVYHAKHKHVAGTGVVTTTVKLPKTIHQDGFPTEIFSVFVTPNQPVIASVSNQTRYDFDVTLTAIDGGAIAEGVLAILAVG
jgi:hypothetical protein